MTQSQSNDSEKNSSRQDLGKPFNCSKTAKPPQKDEFLLVPEESPPFTLRETIQVILNDIEETSPAEPLGVLIVKALKAFPAIAEALEAWPDHSNLLGELIEVVRENNRLLRAKVQVGGRDANVG